MASRASSVGVGVGGGPLLPPMIQQATPRRSGGGGSQHVTPHAQQMAATLQPLAHTPRVHHQGGEFGTTVPFSPFVPLFSPSFTGGGGGGLAPVPDAAGAEVDPFIAQLASRRYNLMIRAAPATIGGSSSASSTSPRKKKVQQSIESGALLQLGQAQARRGHFLTTEASTSRDAARLQRMFGESSTYARRQKRQADAEAKQRGRAEQQEQELQQQQQQHEEKQPLSPVPAATQLLSSTSTPAKSVSSPPSATSAQLKQRRLVHAYLCSSSTTSATPAGSAAGPTIVGGPTPASHRFFAHLARPPLITEQVVGRLVDESARGTDTLAPTAAGEAALAHLRALDAEGAKFDTTQALINAVVARELRERTSERDSQRTLALRHHEAQFGVPKGRGQPTGTQQHENTGVYAHAAAAEQLSEKSEHERLLSAVTERDKLKLVAFLSSGAEGDAHGEQMVPCRLFEESEGVAATERDLAELLVAGSGLRATLNELVRLDRDGRRFEDLEQLAHALRAARMHRAVEAEAKAQLAEYFARGEERHSKELQRRRQPVLRGGGGAQQQQAQEDKRSAASQASAQAAAGMGACTLFLHLPTLVRVTARDIDRLYDEGTAGALTLKHLREISHRGGDKVNSVAQLAPLVLHEHLEHVRRQKLPVVPVASARQQAKDDAEATKSRNEVLRLLNAPDCGLLAGGGGKKEEGKEVISSSSSSASLAASSSDISLLLACGGGAALTLGLLRAFVAKGGLRVDSLHHLAVELRRAHVELVHQLIAFFRSRECGLWRTQQLEDQQEELLVDETKQQEATSTQVDIPATSTTSSPLVADPWTFTLSEVSHLASSSLLGPHELLVGLGELERAGRCFVSLTDLSEALVARASLTASQYISSGLAMLEVLDLASMLPLGSVVRRDDLERLQHATGSPEDALVLLKHLAERGRSFETIEVLAGALSGLGRQAAQQKRLLAQHLLSANSSIFAKLAWNEREMEDAGVQALGPTVTDNATGDEHSPTQRINHHASLIYRPRGGSSLASASSSSALVASGTNATSRSLFQLVEEAAAAETRLRMAKLTGVEIVEQQHQQQRDERSSSSADYAHLATEWTRGDVAWNCASLPPLPSPAVEGTGVVYLTPREISRLYRLSGAGPSTLSLLWRLESSRSRAACSSMDGLIAAVRTMHDEELQARGGQEARGHLLQLLAAPETIGMFSRPLAVREEDLDDLIAPFDHASHALAHVGLLRARNVTVASLDELVGLLAASRAEAAEHQRRVLAALRSTRSRLLPRQAQVDAEGVQRVFYESGACFELEKLVQQLEKTTLTEAATEETTPRFANLAELSLAVKAVRDPSASQPLLASSKGQARLTAPQTEPGAEAHSPSSALAHTH